MKNKKQCYRANSPLLNENLNREKNGTLMQMNECNPDHSIGMDDRERGRKRGNRMNFTIIDIVTRVEKRINSENEVANGSGD